MPSYFLQGYQGHENPYKTLRLIFQATDGSIAPAVYCSDYFAKEIAAEKNGETNSSFNYTNSYAGSKWICPNMTESIMHNKHNF